MFYSILFRLATLGLPLEGTTRHRVAQNKLQPSMSPRGLKLDQDPCTLQDHLQHNLEVSPVLLVISTTYPLLGSEPSW